MKISELTLYRCPKCNSKLKISKLNSIKNEIISGLLMDDKGHKFSIKDGFPIFFNTQKINKSDSLSKVEYDQTFHTYDDGMDFFYSTLGLNGKVFDKSLIDLLDLKSDNRVLEIGAGTGRHSKFIIDKLDKNNTFYASDLSSNMLNVFRSKIKRKKISLSLTDASSLPFSDRTFDRVFHFGGLNNFGNITKALQEMTRVTKIGGTIVVGDEGIAPWLKNSIFGKMLTNSNPLFNNIIPIEQLPDNARNVMIKYIANGSFYIIKFNVGEGLPYLNTNIEFPGQRGGSYTTRLFGNLEGVSIDTKNLMEKAAKKSGKSFHKWLEDSINERIKIDLQ